MGPFIRFHKGLIGSLFSISFMIGLSLSLLFSNCNFVFDNQIAPSRCSCHDSGAELSRYVPNRNLIWLLKTKIHGEIFLQNFNCELIIVCNLSRDSVPSRDIVVLSSILSGQVLCQICRSHVSPECYPIVLLHQPAILAERYRCRLSFTLTQTWWRHQVETFSALLVICAGNSPVPGEFPAKASDAELWCFLWSAPE